LIETLPAMQETRWATGHGVTRVGHDLAAKLSPPPRDSIETFL